MRARFFFPEDFEVAKNLQLKRARIVDFEASDMFSDLVMCRLMSITTSWLSFAFLLLEEEPVEQWRSS